MNASLFPFAPDKTESSFASRHRNSARLVVLVFIPVILSFLFHDKALSGQAAALPPMLDRSTFFGSSGIDAIHDVEADSGGNLVIVGRTHMFDPTDFPLRNAYQQASDHKLAPGMHAFVAKFSPVGDLLFSTYLGGELNDEAAAVAISRAGNIFVTGFTQSHIVHGGFALAEFNGFPTTPGAYITNGSVRFDRCVFLTCFNPAGGVVYSTLVTRDGGVGSSGQSVAVDAAGNAYVAGTLDSSPMTLPDSRTVLFSGAFLMKFNPQGSGTLYTNLIPGASGLDVAVEPNGTAHFVGRFSGSNLTTTPGAYDVPAGNGGGFYQKISPDGAVLYSSAFAPRNSSPRAVAVDSEGRALIVGSVSPTVGPLFPGDFLPVNPVQAAFGGGDRDGYLARFDTRREGTNAVDLATFFGGDGFDELTDVAVDPVGRILAVGNTTSSNLTVAIPVSSRLSGERDAFLLQLNPPATGLEFASHLGGSGWETARAITPIANPTGIVIAGDTLSPDFPATNAFQSTFRGVGTEGFLSRFAAATASETFVVNTVNDRDDGVCDTAHCSLREAIHAANARPGPQTISFNIPLANPAAMQAPVIQLTNGLPSILDPVTIDGSSQPGKGWIVLDGSNAGPAAHGLLLDTTQCFISKLAIHSFSKDGIHIFEGGRHTLNDLHVGTDVVGTNRLGNHGAGIRIIASPNNTITGGADFFRGTLISGNVAEGIRIEDGLSVSNRIANATIGLDDFDRPLSNGVAGIHLINAHSTEITNCIVSGNPETGIRMVGLDDARIVDCRVGLWRTQSDPFGPRPGPTVVNARVGISLFDCHGVIIGGSPGNSVTADEVAIRIERGSGNRVEGNSIGSSLRPGLVNRPHFGVQIENSVRNFIGGQTPVTGSAPGNRFSGNNIAVALNGSTADGNVVRGNLFGGPLDVSNEIGVRCSAPESIIGGETKADSNVFFMEADTSSLPITSSIGILVSSIDARGTLILGNQLKAEPGKSGRHGTGILLSSTADIRIGGPSSHPGRPPGNVVGGFSSGIVLSSTIGCSIQGNLAGAVPDEPNSTANNNGVSLVASSANRIGGDEPAAANVIAGNAGIGVTVRGDNMSGAEANRIMGNFIGVASDGKTSAPNRSHGIELGWRAFRNLVGLSPNPARGGRANLIAHNEGDGIHINVALAPSDSIESRNLISRNRIFANGGSGIRSASQGRFPLGEQTIVDVFSALADGNLRSTAITRLRGLRKGGVYRLEFYQNDSCDNSGAGEGQHYLASHDFLAVAEEQNVIVPLGAEHPSGRILTALLLDDRDNTSEFSACFKVEPPVDSDGDSVADRIEDASHPDANADGTPDRKQANVTTIQSPENPRPVTLTGPPGGSFSDVQSPVSPSDPKQLPPGATLPHGQYEFKFSTPVPPLARLSSRMSHGPAHIVIEIVLPTEPVPDAWFAYGSTAESPTPKWFDFRHDGSTGAEIIRNIVRLHFIDGQRGDNDLQVNGVIETVGAPVVLGQNAIRILGILPAGDGRHFISGTGSPATLLDLETSHDLVQWRAEGTSTVPFGTFQFITSSVHPHQFFRVRVP